MKRVYNLDTTSHTWCGQTIDAGSTYDIQAIEIMAWAYDNDFLAAVGIGIAKIYDGISDLTTISQVENLLRSEFPRDTDGSPLIRQMPFASACGFRFRGKGIKGTATAGQTSNIDYKITDERYINGVHLFLENHTIDDTVNFEIVDVDNILGYGAGVVLDRFSESWIVCSEQSDQHMVIIPYPARIIAGLYIRIAYASAGSTDVIVRCNFFLHKKTT